MSADDTAAATSLDKGQIAKVAVVRVANSDSDGVTNYSFPVTLAYRDRKTNTDVELPLTTCHDEREANILRDWLSGLLDLPVKSA